MEGGKRGCVPPCVCRVGAKRIAFSWIPPPGRRKPAIQHQGDNFPYTDRISPVDNDDVFDDYRDDDPSFHLNSFDVIATS